MEIVVRSTSCTVTNYRPVLLVKHCVTMPVNKQYIILQDGILSTLLKQDKQI